MRWRCFTRISEASVVQILTHIFLPWSFLFFPISALIQHYILAAMFQPSLPTQVLIPSLLCPSSCSFPFPLIRGLYSEVFHPYLLASVVPSLFFSLFFVIRGLYSEVFHPYPLASTVPSLIHSVFFSFSLIRRLYSEVFNTHPLALIVAYLPSLIHSGFFFFSFFPY